MLQSPLKVTVIGGCHVVGYPIGIPDSFLTVFQQQLESELINVSVSRFPYLDLNRANVISRICKESKPDLLILQAGNYIFNPIMFKAVRKKIKHLHKSNNRHKETMPSVIPGIDKDGIFIPGKWFLFHQLIKRFIHSLLFYKILNERKCNRYIRQSFEAVEKEGVKNVLIIGAFPTADRVMNKYRMIGNKMLYQQCVNYGYAYFDVFPFIETSFKDRSFTVDFMHFSRKAHHVLGMHLAKKISGFVKTSELRRKMQSREESFY